MIPRIDQVVWRGAWLLLLFQDRKSLEEFYNPDNKFYLKIWWGDKCLAEGSAHSMVDPETIDENRLMLDLVDMAENSGGYLEPATKLEFIMSDGTQEFPIAMATRNEQKWRTWEIWRESLENPISA